MQELTLPDTLQHLILQEHVVLAPRIYMKVGGAARYLIEVTTRANLQEVAQWVTLAHIPYVILGGASNVLVPDEGIDALVIINKTSEISFEDVTDDGGMVIADSGVITARLASETAAKGLAGLHHFVGVPGTVGGAIINNSHFKPTILIGMFVESVTYVDAAGVIQTKPATDLAFAYDYSYFHDYKSIVLSVRFTLERQDPETLLAEMRGFATHRVETQPIGIPSSGCMYRNPFVSSEQLEHIQSLTGQTPVNHFGSEMQVPAGYLIDKAGLKLTTIGGAQVSEKHATYLINTGSATSKDVEALCQLIESTVYEKFGVQLEREVFFLKQEQS